MNLLALDTATEACSVSLAVGNCSIHRYVELDRGHAEQLLPMVDSVLAEGGISLTALHAIAFGRGPGGFTGVRLAASVAQGLAFGAGVGVIPVSNLAAVAHQAFELSAQAQQALVVNDARMREVYWATFNHGLPPLLIGSEAVSPAGEVLLPQGGGAWVAAGRGLLAWPALAERCRLAGATVHPGLLPRARDVLTIARLLAAAGQIVDPAEALPVYVRDRVAEPAR